MIDILAFGDSIAILGGMFLFVLYLVGGIFILLKVFRSKASRRKIIFVITLYLIPLVLLLLKDIREGDIELNPMIGGDSDVIGEYVYGDYLFRLNSDHSYVAVNLEGLSEGSWSRDDWNLFLSEGASIEPRIITRNGEVCIAPFYKGVDDPIGILLRKGAL